MDNSTGVADMAKQIEDTKTADMLGEPKRRGRPATGQAMSAAERKRAQRMRDRHAFNAIEGESGKKTPAEMTITALVENLQHAVSKGWTIDARDLADELVKRAKANRDA